jgi:hypothetical protein
MSRRFCIVGRATRLTPLQFLRRPTGDLTCGVERSGSHVTVSRFNVRFGQFLRRHIECANPLYSVLSFNVEPNYGGR